MERSLSKTQALKGGGREVRPAAEIAFLIKQEAHVLDGSRGRDYRLHPCEPRCPRALVFRIPASETVVYTSLSRGVYGEELNK